MNDVLAIKELIGKDDYIIPIYQRDFAWRREDLRCLVRDIERARCAGVKEYYIGTLVTFRKEDSYEVVDGQQRLTALTILLSLSDFRDSINLHFEARIRSEYALSRIKERYIELDNDHIFYKSYRYFNDFLRDVDKASFFDYLINNVYILRLSLDETIDLNHYFEIMNSRQVQSKETDILYSKLIDLAEDDKDHELIRIVWNALSHFDRFIQQGMAERIWNRFYYGDSIAPLLDSNADEWWDNAKTHIEGDGDDFIGSMDSALIFSNEEHIRAKVREENNIPHYSLIDFPEFIALASEIIYKINIPHDDKLFLLTFSDFKLIKTMADVRFFLHALLKLRFLFDTYIVKIANNQWNLSRYIDVNDFVDTFGQLNGSLCAIESLYASALDDCWIVDSLSYLYENPHLDGDELLEFFKSLLDKYSSERYELYKEKYLSDNGLSDPDMIIVDGKLQKA